MWEEKWKNTQPFTALKQYSHHVTLCLAIQQQLDIHYDLDIGKIKYRHKDQRIEVMVPAYSEVTAHDTQLVKLLTESPNAKKVDRRTTNG